MSLPVLVLVSLRYILLRHLAIGHSTPSYRKHQDLLCVMCIVLFAMGHTRLSYIFYHGHILVKVPTFHPLSKKKVILTHRKAASVWIASCSPISVYELRDLSASITGNVPP